MDIIARLLVCPFTRPAVGSGTAPRPAKPEDASSTVRACGWFESSHELTAGLSITEHAALDGVANALPLDDWLRLHLMQGRACA